MDTALYHTQPVACTFRLQQSGDCHGLSRLVTVFVIVGIVTGIGLVHGREVLFVANDATVKGRLFTVDTFHESQLLLYLPSFRPLPLGLKFFIQGGSFLNVPPVFQSESGAQNALPKVVRIIP